MRRLGSILLGIVPALALAGLVLFAGSMVARGTAEASTARGAPALPGPTADAARALDAAGVAAAYPDAKYDTDSFMPAAGGVITVNTTSDLDSADGVISLREAIYLANGGTDGAGGLARGLSNQEKSQLGGCTWSGSGGDWHITGGCGAGVIDSIVFNLPPLSLITLNAALPAISDTVRTLVDGGSNTVPVIDATGAGSDGLLIASGNNVVMHLAVENAPSHNFRVSGSNNQLIAVHSANGGLDGITLAGSSNSVDGAVVGVGLVFGGCAGSAGDGIRIAGGSQSNSVHNSTVACSGAAGIAVLGAGTDGYHVIGPNNVIGGALPTDAGYANGAAGLALYSNYNTVLTSTLGWNGADGIAIAGNFNAVAGNSVISNTGNGLLLYGTAHDNFIGCYLVCGTVARNRFAANLGYGVELTGSGVALNLLIANDIGLDASGSHAQGNMRGGVLVDGAHDTTIGGAGVYLNNISGNHLSGVTLDHGAYNSTLSNNCIGLYCQFNLSGSLPNSAFGVLLQNGAHDNAIGVSGAGLGNMISSNGVEGILIGGTNTATNTVNNNYISSNGVAGILVGAAAHDNVIGADASSRNTINFNAGDGVVLTSGAYSNTLGYNYIGTNSVHGSGPNSGNGVWLSNGAHDNVIGQSDPQYTNEIQNNTLSGIAIDGASTAHNTIVRNRLYGNGEDGIRLTNATHGNVFGRDTYNELNSVYNNNLSGLSLQSGAHDNAVYFNAFDQNNRHGIVLSGTNTSANVFSMTMIYNNTLDGINSGSGASGNHWTQLQVYHNGGLGIDTSALDDANNTITPPLPVITSVTFAGGNVTITGTATASNILVGVSVELYAVAPDPSGFGEGKTYKSSGGTSSQGIWTVTFAGTSAGCYTAFQTVNTIAGTSDSSEFGPNSCRLFLPLIRR